MPGTVSLTNKEPVWLLWSDVLLGFIDDGDVTLNVDITWNDFFNIFIVRFI